METRNGHIVLIVDDSLLICEQIKASLKEENIFITEAHTGEEAEAMVKQYQPDLILLDVVLPDADGYTLFDRLKAVDQNGASILFLTSKDKDDDVVKGFSKGACDYIKKPFVRGELLSRVRAHLQLKQQKDELNRQNRELRSNMEKLNYMAFRDGLMFRTKEVLGVGETFSIVIPAMKENMLYECTIRRSVEKPENYIGYGCEFSEMTNLQEDILYRYILRCQNEQLKRIR